MDGVQCGNAKSIDADWSAYKKAQVRCKQASVKDIHNLPGFVDFLSAEEDDRIIQLENPTKINNDGNYYYQGPMFGISSYPGFVFLPQAVSESLQVELAFQAVTEYCESPHATNIDLIPPKPLEENINQPSMWHLWKQENGFVVAKKGGGKKKYYKTFRKLSWATTGYHYDWTARAYHEGAKSDMPDLLKSMATIFAQTALATMEKPTPTTFTPSASIVNYYTIKSIMGGHRDDLEYALDKPVVSISLGLPAIFLLGGKTKQSTPVLPILVRPGDVMILGGDARLNFHGMAKVLLPNNVMKAAESLPKQLTLQDVVQPSSADGSNDDSNNVMNEEDQKAIASFLSQHRININVRQVHKD